MVVRSRNHRTLPTSTVAIAIPILFAVGCTGDDTGLLKDPDEASAPVIVTHPSDTMLFSGESATLSVSAEGTRPLEYQWSRDGSEIAGADGRTYTTPQLFRPDSGAAYVVRVTNLVGEVVSDPAVVTVITPEPPVIVSEPRDTAVEIGQPVSFSVEAEGTPPLTYQWYRDGAPIAGATGATHSIEKTTRPDSLAAFSVRLSNRAGSVDSREARVVVTGARVFGLSGFLPNLDDDLLGLRFRALVHENLSESLRLIFGFFGVWAPGSSLSGRYSFEANIYSGTNHFDDGTCSTWPPTGTYAERKSSLLLGLADYPYHFELQPGPTIGIRTGDPENYPVQTGLIDGIPRLWKSTARSQTGLNGEEILVTVLRGDTLSDVSAYEHCDLELEPVRYRRWIQRVETSVGVTEIELVLPDEHARYVRNMHVLSEFLHGSGAFTVQYWDFAALPESTGEWTPVTAFRSSYLYDGNGQDYGVRLVLLDAGTRIEITNVEGGPHFLRDVPFSY